MHLQNKLVKKTDAIIETTKIGWFFIKLINLVYRKELFILSKILDNKLAFFTLETVAKKILVSEIGLEKAFSFASWSSLILVCYYCLL